MSYLARRVITGFAQVFLLSLISFLLLSVAPGYFGSEDRLDPQRSTESLRLQRQIHQLDKPWAERYVSWLRSCASGNGGDSLSYGVPVGQLVAARAPRTLAIVIPAWVISWISAVALGAAIGSNRKALPPAESSATIAAMMPEIITGSLLLWAAVAAQLPIAGAWLPIVTLAVPLTAVVFLHSADGFRDAFAQRHVQLAAARGIPRAVLWSRYVFRAAANPLLSLLGPSAVAVAGSALAVEALTGWPGIGTLFLDAFHSRDYPVVQGVLLLLGAILTIFNLLADLALYRLDPRLRNPDDNQA